MTDLLPEYYRRFVSNAPPGSAEAYPYDIFIEDWKCQVILWCVGKDGHTAGSVSGCFLYESRPLSTYASGQCMAHTTHVAA